MPKKPVNKGNSRMKVKTNGKFGIDNLPFVQYNLCKLTERRKRENVRMLKAKRVERNLRQKDLANALGITEKAICHKECSEENKFNATEMLTLVEERNLSYSEFEAIFFNHELTKRLRITDQKKTSGKQ